MKEVVIKLYKKGLPEHRERLNSQTGTHSQDEPNGCCCLAQKKIQENYVCKE